MRRTWVRDCHADPRRSQEPGDKELSQWVQENNVTIQVASHSQEIGEEVRRIVVGFSGGVTSAWCAGWALRTFPKDEVVFLFNDTKEEDKDTYRFLRQMSERLGVPITDQSDGRSVTEVFRDNGMIANNRAAFCSRILKTEQRDKYFEKLRSAGVTEIVSVVGYTQGEWQRIQRATMRAEQGGYAVRFPLVECEVSKQQAADWCISLGVRPSKMYLWSDHANCVGCVRGGKAYWLAVKANRPDVFEQRKSLEDEFKHSILNGTTLVQLEINGLKRRVDRKESIEIGPCECGD